MRHYLGLLLCLLFSLAAFGQIIGSRPGKKIMIFGGPDHDVYLGCLSCGELERDSVLNEIGKYGSAISQTSIFNSISQYGSAIYPTSACNEIAVSPPVIVDNKGGYYGELTMNQIRPKRVKSDAIRTWLASVCNGK